VSSNVRLPLEISLDDLAEQLRSMDHEMVFAFLVRVDEMMADCDFTERMRDTLTVALEQEGVGSPAAPFINFCQWLVRMDDPHDLQGVKDRQVVTLDKILSRARGLLEDA
jgi:hypothetical protein